MEHRNLTDVVFKLSIDLGLQLEGSPELEGIDIPQIQMRVLRLVLEAQEVTPLAVAKAIRRDKGHVTRLLAELTTKELVEILPSPRDGRSKIVTLTPKSLDIFTRVRAAEGVIFRQAVTGIDEKKLETFFDVAEKISRNLSSG